MRFENGHTSSVIRRRVRLHWLTAALLASGAHPAFGQTATASDDLRAQIATLRAEQAHIDELQRQTEAKLRALEARLGAEKSSPVAASSPPAS